jgi:hypothetical protein
MGDKLNLGIRCQDEGVVSIRQSFLAALVCGAWSVFFLMQGVTYANAQGANLLSSSYITPFPQTDRYQVRIIGDWLGTGLTAGLEEAFKPDGSLQITDMSRSNYGLLRAEQAGLYAEVDRMISGPPVHIAIIMMGVNDRLSIRTPTGRIQPGSEEWRDAYGKEAEKLIKKLRGANIAVYWVGLPVMSNPALSEAVAAMNNAVRQTAYLNGAKFIETATGFTDQLGAYSAYGPDLTGQTKRLREGDGVGLTAAGNRKLANYVEIALRRDLAQARAQRNIPLAGDEEEQARVVPGASRGASPKGTVGPDAQPAMAAARPDAGNTKIAARANGVPTFKTETSAPATPPQDAAHRDQAAFAGSGYQQGELILSDLGNGLTAIAVISPVNEFSIRDIQRQTPLADRVYFKVLSKGEALPAKEGRADDFRWREDGAAQTQ